MGTTDIEWADATLNWQSGCTNAGPECDSCYAEKMSHRLANMGQERYRGATKDWAWIGAIRFDPIALRNAFAGLGRKRAPIRAFPGSMTDLWHRDAPADGLAAFAAEVAWLAAGIAAGRIAPHTLMCLTKRPENLLAWQRLHFPEGLPPCFWAGTTAGNQRGADIRVPKLLDVRASVRFVSIEPMLGPVNLERYLFASGDDGEPAPRNEPPLPCLHWIIVGCESIGGRAGRPTDEAWVRDLRDQCATAGVPFFLKQLVRDGRVVGMPTLDGVIHDAYPTPRTSMAGT